MQMMLDQFLFNKEKEEVGTIFNFLTIFPETVFHYIFMFHNTFLISSKTILTLQVLQNEKGSYDIWVGMD